MAILNITLNGHSADYQLEIDYQMNDRDLKRVALELVRSGEMSLLKSPVEDSAFDHYVVDRFETPSGGQRIYLRPKVPFGAR